MSHLSYNIKGYLRRAGAVMLLLAVMTAVAVSAVSTSSITVANLMTGPAVKVRVAVDKLNVYELPDKTSKVVRTHVRDDIFTTVITEYSMCMVTIDEKQIGYTDSDGFIYENSVYYAELPLEYGNLKTSTGEIVPAVSHLVDVRKYTDKLEIYMILSTDRTTKGKPFYSRDLCLLQYDTLKKLLNAQEKFEADGYRIKIYDAYRPTSVQQEWFDLVKVHKWVANPSQGDGGIHDRGIAVDMTLIDKNGKEIEMPTAVHTFTEDSARNSSSMTEEARKNMEYMTNIMLSVGFTTINSEWWHFQDSNKNAYLPTDHPLDSIPLVLSE